MFDERVEAIAVNLEDSWSETFFSKVDYSLAKYEDFRYRKRHKSLKTSEYCFEKYVGDCKKDRTLSEACNMCKIRGAGRTGLPARTSWSCKECFARCVNFKHRIYIHLQCFGEHLNAVIKLFRAIMSELISCWSSYLKFRSAVASKFLLCYSVQQNLSLWYVFCYTLMQHSVQFRDLTTKTKTQWSTIKITFALYFYPFTSPNFSVTFSTVFFYNGFLSLNTFE